MMYNEEINKVYFVPGQIVKVKHFENAPEMYVVEKRTRSLRNEDGSDNSIFLGILCRWFDKENRLQEAIFSTKDLIHVKTIV